MLTPRRDHAAVRLLDGRVFVTGGLGLQTSEVFDLISNAWTSAAPSLYAHSGGSLAGWSLTAVVLGDGRVMIADTSAARASEIYDAVKDAWETTSPAPQRSDDPANFAVALGDGRVLVLDAWSPTMQIYTPTHDTWKIAAAVLPGNATRAILLADHRVFILITRGSLDAVAAIYDPVADQSTPTSAPPPGFRAILAQPVLLPDGRVLLPSDASTSAAYDPGTDTWTQAPATLAPHGGFGPAEGVSTTPVDCESWSGFAGAMSALLPSGSAALLGGEETGQYVSGSNCPGFGGTLCNTPAAFSFYTHPEVQVLDAMSLTWHAGPQLQVPLGSGAVTPLDGALLVTGGVQGVWDTACPEHGSDRETVLSQAQVYKEAAPAGGSCTRSLDCVTGCCDLGVCIDLDPSLPCRGGSGGTDGGSAIGASSGGGYVASSAHATCAAGASATPDEGAGLLLMGGVVTWFCSRRRRRVAPSRISAASGRYV